MDPIIERVMMFYRRHKFFYVHRREEQHILRKYFSNNISFQLLVSKTHLVSFLQMELGSTRMSARFRFQYFIILSSYTLTSPFMMSRRH